jgi:hypothetical protein
MFTTGGAGLGLGLLTLISGIDIGRDVPSSAVAVARNLYVPFAVGGEPLVVQVAAMTSLVIGFWAVHGPSRISPPGWSLAMSGSVGTMPRTKPERGEPDVTCTESVTCPVTTCPLWGACVKVT